MTTNQLLDDIEELLLEHGYRFVRFFQEEPFVGLFTDVRNKPRLVVIKRTDNVGREYELMRAVLAKAPKAPIVHPVAMISVGPDREYLVMQYVLGVALSQLPSLLQREPIMVRRFIAMLHKLTDLLATTGLHHGDLHLGNILTHDELETFTVIDFGMAKLDTHLGKRTYAVWEDIAAVSSGLALPGASESMQSYRDMLMKRDSGYERTTFDPYEDVACCRHLIELFRQAVLG
jgi:tRNA A-37 threonylcarbamoyl transferase component Bud32